MGYNPDAPWRPAAPMNNFRRAIKLALRYRGRLIVSLICALLAAALWSLNIAAIYPVLQVVEKKKNLQEWSDGKLSDLNQQIAEKERLIDASSIEKKKIEAWPVPDQAARTLK